MPTLAVILNRNARHFARNPAHQSLVSLAAGPRAIVIETRDLAELSAAARQVRHAAPDLIALCGGDGTYTCTLTALASAYGDVPLPPIALIPAGTVGTVARNMGMQGSPSELMTRVATLFAADRLPTQPHLTVQANQNIGFIFGAALVANFFDLYQARGSGGLLVAAQIVSRIFLSSLVGGRFARRVLDPVRCSLVIDGESRSPASWSLVVCSTVPNAGLHMLVNHRARERLDRLHLVASPLPTEKLGPQMFRVLAGKVLRGDEHVDQLVRGFTIEFPERGSWVLDGEVYAARRISVSCGPLLRIVRGPLG